VIIESSWEREVSLDLGMRGLFGCSEGMAKREPKTRSRKKAPTLRGLRLEGDPSHVWFSRDLCIVRRGEWRELMLHGTRAASWRVGETAIRNALLVELAQDPRIVLEDLAKAFELSSEAVRLIRRRAEAHGVLAVMLPAPRRRDATAPELREQMEKLFAQGKGVGDVLEALAGKVSKSTVRKYRLLWEALPARKVLAAEPQQQALPSEPAESAPAKPEPAAPGTAPQAEPESGEVRAPREESEHRVREGSSEAAEDEEHGVGTQIAERSPSSRRGVQHAGVWILFAMVGRLGLYQSARKLVPANKSSRPLRVAFDAVLAALAIGEGCAEGVRRLASRAGAALLLASASPSATWVRRALGGVVHTSEEFHAHFAAGLFRAAQEQAEPGRPVVFYVDNHTREYTGEELLTWHWKMQEDRAVRGVTNYWIHDACGRPVSAVTAFQQGSLVAFLPSCAKLIRAALGEDAKALVVFDRAGAFPTTMSELKALPEGPVDFLTYERAPFPRHGRVYFERHGASLNLPNHVGKKQHVLTLDGGTYLGEGRGKVRRVSLLMPDDTQINLLTSSSEDAAWLARTLFARWAQENAFKYGKERWGFDQLDSRQVVPYPKGTLIPNPYRANLIRSRDSAAEREGELRCRLARMPKDASERGELTAGLANATEMVALTKKALRRSRHHVAIEDTHLYGKLVHHRRGYKLLLDTLRIAGVTAEDHLARMLRPRLSTEPEAKKVVQNLFKAAGNIQVADSHITVSLDPSANRAELRAIRSLLDELNSQDLSHPGDPRRRTLRFRLQPALSPQGA
jgi:hypothetical protein